MFAKATVFSAVLVFILFGIAGIKYMQVMQAKNQPSPAVSTSSQK